MVALRGSRVVLLSLSAACGGSGGDADFEPLPTFGGNAFRESVFQLVIDANGEAMAATEAQIWRYSRSRDEWGQVGLRGRPDFVPQLPFAVADDGQVYAVSNPLDTTYVYHLPAGGGQWETFDEGLPLGAGGVGVVVDHRGVAYLQTDAGIFRRGPTDAEWSAFDLGVQSDGHFYVAGDNSIYLRQPVARLAPGGSSFDPLPMLTDIFSVNADGSVNAQDATGATGRIAAGSSQLEPFPTMLPNEPDLEPYLPWAFGRTVSAPTPFGGSSDGTIYCIGAEQHSGYVQVLSLSRGASAWAVVGGAPLDSIGRGFVAAPDGDIYSFADAPPVTEDRGVFVRRKP